MILRSLERRASPENPSTSLSKPAAWLTSLFAGAEVAGVKVTSESSLSSSTVYACVRILSENLASLPLDLYRSVGRNKEKAKDHPLYWLLHNEPNQMQSHFQWMESEQARLLLWGNSFNEVEYSNNGKIISLLPLHASNVSPFIENNQKFYKLALASGGNAVLNNKQCLHIAGFGFDGIAGLNPITTNKGAIGLSLAAEKFGQSLFKNGVRTSGALEHPGTLSDAAYENLKTSFTDTYAGVHNANKPMILEEGMKWVQMGMSPGDAQILETRKFQVADVARIFNVPPHMIGDLERSTNNNIEQQAREFVDYSIRPWLIRWEQELNRILLQPHERQDYFFKFNVDGLLRGDIGTRFESYKKGREMGMYSTNEIREKEDLNPIDAGDNDYIMPLNMGLASQVGENNEGDGNNAG